MAWPPWIKIRDLWRRREREKAAIGGSDHRGWLEAQPQPEALPLDEGLSDEASICRRALQFIRNNFEARTWRAFWRTAVDDQSARDVAEELGLTPVAVRKAKSRVLHRLRRELAELVDFAGDVTRGRSYSRALILYSLGAILYFLLTAHPPFRGDTVVGTIQLVLNAEPVSARQRNLQISLDLASVCAKCLEKNPAQRYASAAELADDLRRYLRGEPLQARPLATADRVWRWCRRNPKILSLSTLGPYV